MAKQATKQAAGGLWKKRILVPFWIVRICIMIFVIGSYAYTLRTINQIQDVVKPAVASVVVFLLLIVIVLLIDVLAIVLFLRDALKPGTFLTMNMFQTSFWTGVLIMDIISITKGGSHVAVGFSAFVFLTFVGLLIYSYVGFKKAKNAALRGNYAPAHNPALATSSVYQAPHHEASPYTQNNAYQSPMSGHTDSHSPYLPPYQAGHAADYYTQPPVKAAHMV